MDHSGIPLIHTHDLGLVVLSIIIAILASYTALDLAGRVTAAQGRARFSWLVGGAVAMGLGIWSMHFTAMLAFNLPLSVAYNVPTVLLSLLVAIIASGIALFVTSRRVMGLLQLLGGGFVMGLAIASMHYIGMAAMRVQATLHYDPALFTLSIVIAIGASWMALWLAFRFRSETDTIWNWWKSGSAIVMGAAISGMHYIGMAAAIFIPNESLVIDLSNTLDVSLLGTASIVVVTFIVLGFSLLLSLIDQRLAAQATYLAEREKGYHSTLQTLNEELEARVADLTRATQALEASVQISRRLSIILDQKQLMVEVVNQIKERFGYYHAHIYLLDETGQSLVVAEGTGLAGAEMKARKHSIPLNTSKSLVARAAQSGKTVRVDNVRETEDWLPNSLLPDTYSEMAVPITLGVDGQVVGVLDVQQDKPAGFDEGDAKLLRSLADQVAVAIRNAHLFAEVESALTNAQAVQNRYFEQVWDKSKLAPKNTAYLYTRPDAPVLAEALSARAKVLALAQKGPAVITVDNDEMNFKSLVAPVVLGGKTIGAFQLHKLDVGDNDQIWHEQDLALVEAVLDQVAQTAENLRLFEETRERASYEQTVRQITDKLRAAPNLDTLLETAARELGQRLGVRHTVLELGLKTGPLVTNAQNGQSSGSGEVL